MLQQPSGKRIYDIAVFGSAPQVPAVKGSHDRTLFDRPPQTDLIQEHRGGSTPEGRAAMERQAALSVDAMNAQLMDANVEFDDTIPPADAAE